MLIFAIILYILIGVIITKPWNNDGGLFCISIPWWVMAILCLLWLPIALIRVPFALKENGVKAITDGIKGLVKIIKIVILHIWLPFIIYYKMKDMKDDKPFRQFQKSLTFRHRWNLDLFKKVQSVKDEIGYMYWATGEDTYLSDGSIIVECQMCQRLR
jgi:hypothetical protein